MTAENNPELGSLLFTRSRAFFPVNAGTFGVFVTLLAAACGGLLLNEGYNPREDFTLLLIAILGVPFGIVLAVVGWRSQPVFQFFERGFKMDGPVQRTINYSEVTEVRVNVVHLMIMHAIRYGTLHVLNLRIGPDDEWVSCGIQSGMAEHPEIESLAAHIEDVRGNSDRDEN